MTLSGTRPRSPSFADLPAASLPASADAGASHQVITQTGLNYELVLFNGIARARVWRRPDLDWSVGARCAEEISEAMRAMAARPETECFAAMLDLREAPPVSGPLTQASITALAVAFEQRGRRIAIVSGESAMMQLQLGRIARDAAPLYGKLCTDLLTAEAWCLRGSVLQRVAR